MAKKAQSSSRSSRPAVDALMALAAERGWLAVSLLIMAFITPSLIRKQPGAQPPPDYTPAALWFGAIIFFALSAGGAGLWSVVVLDAVLASVVFLFCWRGAKW